MLCAPWVSLRDLGDHLNEEVVVFVRVLKGSHDHIQVQEEDQTCKCYLGHASAPACASVALRAKVVQRDTLANISKVWEFGNQEMKPMWAALNLARTDSYRPFFTPESPDGPSFDSWVP
ncbi:MAG: uncharacterized protein KVP18_003108 [Porospora cf. gigantea A]|uniref:uncharacterized protein n=1 Tax=Porospora cf. gigantea A TaxID=2853593 RepID=UPI00355A7CF3|nr:MAG: hypothetical protein KVP18_003108 [Porospora cf. gigantea A]